jgi:hypothetical protein
LKHYQRKSKKGEMKMKSLLKKNLVVGVLVCSLVSLLSVETAHADIFSDANLVGFWQFSGDANDSSFYGHDGTPQADADTSEDVLELDGTGDYVEVADDPNFQFTQSDSFSICLWARPDSNSGGYILSKMRGSDCYDRKFGYQVSHSNARFSMVIDKSCTSSTGISTSSESAPLLNWYHMVAVYDNNDVKLYLNGNLDGSGTFTEDTGSTYPDKAMAIGARSYDATVTSYFDGAIDDVMIYNVALEAWEIRQLYNEANKGYRYANEVFSKEFRGQDCNVLDDYCTALGLGTSAEGTASTAMGGATTASGNYSTAMGAYSVASGSTSTAMGSSTASGLTSTAMGSNATASGYVSTAMGTDITASGDYSFALGKSFTNSTDNSFMVGYGDVDLKVADDAVNVYGDLDVSAKLTMATMVLPVKTTTGDPGSPVEGQIYVNTYDNKVRVYADGAWRDLATW